MSRIFQAASAVAITVTALAAVALTVPGLAQNANIPAPGDVIFESSAVVQPLSTSAETATETSTATASQADNVDETRHARPASLATMVREMAVDSTSNAELRCLAIGVYHESRAEPLEGQLAVAHVILNRARSGRFANSVCGVLTQPHQFSFVRGGVLSAPGNNAQWRTSVGVARVAMAGEMASPAPGAMYFHAARVSPGWNRLRIARLGNHVFYR